MTNSERINSNNALIDEAIAKANALPDAGSGGGSVETCTVTISDGSSYSDKSGVIQLDYCYNTYENGEVHAYFSQKGKQSPVVLENVIKGSILTIYPAGHSCEVANATKINTNGSTIWAYTIDSDNATIHAWTCFVYDTDILLANYKTKKVQDITYADELLVWDFDNGCFSSARPVWIKKEQTANYYYRCEFDNGTVLNLVGSDGKCHRVFNIESGTFESATECVGKRIMTERGETVLLSCERVDKEVSFYNIITNTHLNLFAEGVLTSCRLNNIYPIEDMRFVKDGREERIYETYSDIDIDMFNGLRLSEQTMAVDEVNSYVNRLCSMRRS